MESAGDRPASDLRAPQFPKLKKHLLRLFSKRTHWSVVVPTASGACLVLVLASSCSTLTRTAMLPPEIPGAHFVGNPSCLECHSDLVRRFPSSPHTRVHFENGEMPPQSGCESCHGPGSLHVEAGGGRRLIVNPRNQPDTCFACHLETHAEFSLPQHHLVIEGKMNCIQCHDPHGADILKPSGGPAMARLNETCAQCHREQTRPVIFEHPALREGCTVCHNPHGSINPKMLVQPDNNLCLRCHAQSAGPGAPAGRVFIGNYDHTELLRMGACFNAGCHTAVHGSSVSRTLLY